METSTLENTWRNVKAFAAKTLSSRKFWAAVAASIPFATAEPPDWVGFSIVWAGYAGIEGLIDAMGALKRPRPGSVVESTLTLTETKPDANGG